MDRVEVALDTNRKALEGINAVHEKFDHFVEVANEVIGGNLKNFVSGAAYKIPTEPIAEL